MHAHLPLDSMYFLRHAVHVAYPQTHLTTFALFLMQTGHSIFLFKNQRHVFSFIWCRYQFSIYTSCLTFVKIATLKLANNKAPRNLGGQICHNIANAENIENRGEKLANVLFKLCQMRREI